MVGVLIVLAIAVALFARWAFSHCDDRDSKGPIVHLDQQAPYKLEPPQNKTESESSQSN